MTHSNDMRNCRSKQSWLKDVQAKSATKLIEISATTANFHNISNKNDVKRNKELLTSMVYHESAPIIYKDEQHGQSEFCERSNAARTPSMQLQTNTHNGSHSLHELETSSAIEPMNTYTTGTATAAANTTTTTTNPNFLASMKTVNYSPKSTMHSTLISTAQQSGGGAEKTLSPAPSKAKGKSNMSKTQFKCDICGMTFGSKSAHTSHTKSHANSGELSVVNVAGLTPGHSKVIGEADVTLSIPKTPQIKANASAVGGGGDPYQCNVCQKTFAVPARLIRHYRTHTGERPFECEFCHKLFSVKENLQVHRRIHTKERPYKCDVCGRAFEHSGKLHRHMRIHTGERPHKCSVCEKTFIQSGQLVIHMRTHTGEKPYKCPVEGCGKGFTCSKQLKVHSRTHTGEKPYHCDICFRDFGYNHVLKLHRVQHYGSKCYKCTICDETFKSKKEMEAHIKGHANELPNDEEGANADENELANSQSTAGGGGESSALDSNPANIQSDAINTTIANNCSETALTNMTITSPSPISSPTSGGTSYLSVESPTLSSAASPTTSIIIETDHHSHDSGIANSSKSFDNTTPSNSLCMPNQSVYNIEELPTDLTIHQAPAQVTTQYYHHEMHSDPHQQLRESESPPLCYIRNLSSDSQQIEQTLAYSHNMAQEPTINPALLEAASIASRRVLLDSREEEVTQAALQILQLNRSQRCDEIDIKEPHAPPPALLPNAESNAFGNDLGHFDDACEANELIEHYKRGDLARHGIHKGYAPVPKFQSSLRNNDIIVRQVEAAIAPLRSSTESPERSSSPESDSMMMADRDVMTLPLRKRKLYMSDKEKQGATQQTATTNNSNSNINKNNGSNGSSAGGALCDVNAKVVRMSSVIQFAKAS